MTGGICSQRHGLRGAASNRRAQRVVRRAPSVRVKTSTAMTVSLSEASSPSSVRSTKCRSKSRCLRELRKAALPSMCAKLNSTCARGGISVVEGVSWGFMGVCDPGCTLREVAWVVLLVQLVPLTVLRAVLT